jgi:single stranded DNA-binding protein
MSAHAILIGHIGTPGELKRHDDTGTVHLGFTLATGRWHPGKDGAEGKESTTWWSVRLYGKGAERLAEKLGKGDLVEVRGEVEQEEWTGRDGTKRQTLRLHADRVNRLRPRAAAPAPAATTTPPPAVPAGDEPPF